MATTIVKTIKADGTGDYTSLSGWELDRRGDIVDRDTIEIAEIYGGGSVGPVVIASGSAWVTDEDHYIWIRAAKDNEHPGVFDSSKAFVLGGPTDYAIKCHQGFTRIGPGISVDQPVNDPGLADSPHCVMISHIFEDKPCIVEGMICRPTAGGIGIRVEYCVTEGSGHFVKNNICQAVNSTFTPIRATNAKLTAHNNTLIAGGSAPGLEADNDGGLFGLAAAPGIIISENNYIFAASGYSVIGSGSFITKGDNDATNTEDALNPDLRNIEYADAGFLNPYVPAGVFEFQDLHLSVNSVLRAKGKDLRNISIPEARVTVDAKGHQRPEKVDVGALQFISPRIIVSRIKTSGGDFTTLNAWELARRGNLARRNTIEVAEVYGGTVNVAVEMLKENWGVNLQSYVIIRAADGEGHEGIFDDTKAYIKNSTTDKFALYCEVGNTRIGPGLNLENSFFTGVSEDPKCIHLKDIQGGGPVIIDGVIMKNAVAKENNRMVLAEQCRYDPDLPHIIKNSQAFTAGGNTSARGFLLNGNEWRVYNNTVFVFGASAIAIVSDGGLVVCENNYIASGDSYGTQGGGSITQGDNDATENNDANDPSLRGVPRDNTVSVEPIPAAYPNDPPDVHLVDGSPLEETGADLSGVTPSYLSITTDLESRTRTVPYDIGADEHSDPIIPTEEDTEDLFVLF